MLLNANPRTVYAWAMRSLFATGPVAVGMLVLWVSPWWDLSSGRPFAFLMVYMMVLLAATCSLCVAVLSACNLAIHKAFRVGYETGQQALVVNSDTTATLRVVQDPTT